MAKLKVTKLDMEEAIAATIKAKEVDVKEEEEEVYPKFLDNVVALALEVEKASYNFEKEEKELDDMKYHLITTPEEDILSFNLLYAKTQGYLTRANSILIQVLRVKRQWMKYKRDAKKIYRKAFAKLIQIDDIRKLKNQEMRVYVLEDKIEHLVDLKAIIDGVIEDLEAIIDIIKVRTEDLNKANVNLRSQQEITLFLPSINYPVRVKGL